MASVIINCLLVSQTPQCVVCIAAYESFTALWPYHSRAGLLPPIPAQDLLSSIDVSHEGVTVTLPAVPAPSPTTNNNSSNTSGDQGPGLPPVVVSDALQDGPCVRLAVASLAIECARNVVAPLGSPSSVEASLLSTHSLNRVCV